MSHVQLGDMLRQHTVRVGFEDTAPNIPEAEVTYVTNTPKPDILLATGWGETDLERIVSDLGNRGIRLAAYNTVYPPVERLDASIVDLTVTYTPRAIIEHINAEADRNLDTPLYGVGRSKAGGEILKSARENPELWRGIGVLAPFGVTNRLLGETLKSQRRALFGRIRKAGLLTHDGMQQNSRRLMDEFVAGLDYAVSQDGPRIVKQLVASGLLRKIMIGKADPMFRFEDFKEVLADRSDANNSDSEQAEHIAALAILEEIEGGHEPITTPVGIHQTAQLIRSVIPRSLLEAAT